jgi:hypothetical protein
MDGRASHRTTDGDLEGLDETQRAELHSYEGGGPSDGLVLTDMTRDRGEDYVEDDSASEILDGDPESFGMSIISPDAIGDEVVDGDIDDEMLDTEDDA